MMKKIIIIFILQTIANQVFSQIFQGNILSKEKQKTIAFANVYLVELQTGTTADSLGHFVFANSFSGIVHFQISAIGHQTELFAIDFSNETSRDFLLSESHLELSEVVISTPHSKLQQDNIVAVIQKNMAAITRNGTTNLTEAISSIPGVDNFSTGSGIGKPVIRGLSGNRIVTYAQNTRVENQQWGDEHGLGIGEVGIEKVEIIKGASSLLYGADAIGGVLFFSDERYAALNTTEGFISSKLLSNNLGTVQQIGLKSNKNDLRMNVFGSFSSHADYQLPDLNRARNTRFDEANVKASMGYNVKNWIGNLRYSFLNNHFGITEDNTPSTSRSRKVELPTQHINNHLLTFDNTYFVGKTKFNAILAYSQNNRKEFEDTLAAPNLSLALKTFSYNLKSNTSFFSEKLNLLNGIQGMFQQNTNRAEKILIPDAAITDVGLYSVLHYAANKKLHFEGGIRLDSRKISTTSMQSDEVFFPALQRSFNNVNYALGSSYHINNVTIKTNIATGFRAPTSAELLSNGTHEGTLRYEIGNQNLTNEKATQFDFNLSFEKEHFSFFLNPFLNHIKNYIFIAPTDSLVDDLLVFEYQQKTANLFGGETGFHWHPHPLDWLHIECNYSSVFAKDKLGNSLPLIPAQKVQTTLKGEFNTKGNLKIENIFIEHIYRFAQNKIALNETQTPDYQLINVGIVILAKAKKTNIEFTTGVRNVLNTAYIDHLSRFKYSGINNAGRNVYLSAKLSF